jgi:putative membrane protein
MSRSEFDQAAQARLAQRVKDIESKSDVELILVVRARSGNYSHIDMLWGIIASFIGLNFMLLSPFTFSHYFVGLDCALLFLMAFYLSRRSDWLRSKLATRKFMNAQVRNGAAAAFYETSVANTENETGLLVYISLLEQRLEMIADRGILINVPALEWNSAVSDIKRAGRAASPQTIEAALIRLGILMATHVPARSANANQLQDLPRFELD